MEEVISYNPADGSEVGRVGTTMPDEVRAAVGRSREVFLKWKKTSFAERRGLVMKAREVILADIEGIAHLISAESGKPFGEAIAMEIAPVLDLMQYFARSTEKMLRPRRIGIGLYGLLGRSSRVVYHPLGVVGIIPAWNYPFSIPLGETVMALMAGNTVVIKPSELTPLTGVKIGEIFEKAQSTTKFRLPNLVQIVSGDGVTGAALVDAAPDKIMFTGSVMTGKKIATAAAKNLTSVVLELGGKDPMIVFDDANLELAAGAAVWGAFCNSGQSCSSVERLYVHESVAEELTRKIVEKTRALTQGSGDRENVSIGAMSSERQIKIVEDHVNDFRKAGAKIETGGRRSGDTLLPMSAEHEKNVEPRAVEYRDGFAEVRDGGDSVRDGGGSARDGGDSFRDGGDSVRDGGDSVGDGVGSVRDGVASVGDRSSVPAPLFYEPTVISGAANDMRAMQEETFGPTLPICTFKTEEEAIALANDSEFGLTASVWTRDYERGRRVATQIEAGSVCVNDVLYTHGIGQTPWGGFKNSGRGRTHGREGLMEFVQPQHIHINRIAILPNVWWFPYSPTAVETFRGFARYFASGSIVKTTRLLPQLWKRIKEMR